MKNIRPTACMLLINDIHLSKDNIADFHKNWNEALEICQNRQISTIVIGGDLWQSRSGQTLNVLMAAREAILKATGLGIYVIIEPGNHDKVDPESILSYNHIFSAYPNVDVIDESAGYGFGDNVTLWLISYFPENGSFQDKLRSVIKDLDDTEYNILYCHQGINGVISNASEKELPTQIFERFDKVLVGHYHNRAVIKGTNIEYIGSSRQHNFGEDEEKGYTILYSDGSTEFVKNCVNERFVTIEINADQISKASQLIAKHDDDTKIRVKITGSSDEVAAIDKNALIELGVSKIEISASDSASFAHAQDFDTKFDKAGLKEEYTRFCIQKEIENIEMGLRYLDKIN